MEPAGPPAASEPTAPEPVELTVLVDADNVAPGRAQPVLDMIAERPGADIIASGHPAALDRLRWPAAARLLPHLGWQRADLALAQAYSPGPQPLVIVSGDGDFGLLAARHPGPVLVISGAANQRLREAATVLDPAIDGLDSVRRWLTAAANP